MAGAGLDLDRLARQRVGHVDRPVRALGDAVAAVAEWRDRKALVTCMPPAPIGIRGCRRRLRSARDDAVDGPAERAR